MRKNIMVKESLYEFAKRGRPKKRGRKPKVGPKGIDATDKWDIPEDDDEMIDPDEFEVDTSDMETAEEIEVEEEDVFNDKLFKALHNEIKVSEPNRRVLKFRLKGDLGKVLQGVPMIQMDNNAFVFKLRNGALKKIFLRDIITEQEKSNRAKMVNEYFPDEKKYNWKPLSSEPEDDNLDGEECEHDVDPKTGKCRKCKKYFRPQEDDI